MPRLGVRLDTRMGLTPKDLLDLALLAENKGFETVWMPEGTGGRDSLTQLAALATGTHRINLGTGILPVFTRTPTVLAMSAGGLDAISQQRFILGLGVGHQADVENGHGVSFSRPLARMRETVEIVRRLLRGEIVTHEGQLFNLRDTRLGFTLLRPDMPIYMAALGPKMLEMAGEIADGILLTWASPAYLKRAIEHLHRGAERAGRDPDDLDVACYIRTAVVEDVDQVRPALQRQIARYAGMPFYANFFQQSGFEKEIAAVKSALTRGDRDAAATAITDAMQREVAIFGSAEHCRREIEALRSQGVKQTVIAPFAVAGDAMGSFRAAIDAFSG